MGILLTIATVIAWIFPCFVVAGLTSAIIGIVICGLFKYWTISFSIIAFIMAIYFVLLY